MTSAARQEPSSPRKPEGRAVFRLRKTARRPDRASPFSRSGSIGRDKLSRQITISFRSARSARVKLITRLRFSSNGDGIKADPHQSPFWIKVLRLPREWGRHSTPGSAEPQKILSTLFLSKCLGARYGARPASQLLWLAAIGGVQRRVGSGQGRISQNPHSTAKGWDETAANQVKWLQANAWASSPPQPSIQPVMQTPSSRRTRRDPAGCNNTPWPVCGRPF